MLPFQLARPFLVSVYSRTPWASDPSLAPHALAKSMDSLSSEQTLTAQILAREDVKYDETHLVQLFDTLPSVTRCSATGATGRQAGRQVLLSFLSLSLPTKKYYV